MRPLLSCPLAFASILAISAPAYAGPATKHDLAGLEWLAGSWSSDSADVRIEEHWAAPRGGLMVGMHRDVARGRAVSFEFLRIVDEDSTLAYLASPRGRPATRFGLERMGERMVAFSNPRHDFPQRITYWLDDAKRLHARVEGRLGGREVAEQWCWRSASLRAR